ncbi:ribonuclease HI [Lacticaseibacillus kribbianus]|uniref:ribonuclease HI n=1 Tax=Lacticaseibacillus kribbianus TaxID=2926292 RepID=UPI001CD22451|nr:hypothetical protein [Lacticaseibacillus kribbianus]
MTSYNTLNIYSDGSSVAGKAAGEHITASDQSGWAFVVVNNDTDPATKLLQNAGQVTGATIDRAELTAIIAALKAISAAGIEAETIRAFIDRQNLVGSWNGEYVVITKNADGTKTGTWTKVKKPAFNQGNGQVARNAGVTIANADLWDELVAAANAISGHVVFEWMPNEHDRDAQGRVVGKTVPKRSADAETNAHGASTFNRLVDGLADAAKLGH